MLSLSVTDILRVWEVGATQHPIDRALTILRVAGAVARGEDPAKLSVGQRDARLLAVREATLGTALPAFGRCPACAQAVEFTLGTRELRALDPLDEPSEFQLEVEGCTLRLRLPDSYDLAEVVRRASLEPEQALLARCVLSAVDGAGQSLAPEQMPERLREAISEAIAQRDPAAVISLALTCPSCSHGWRALFDVGEFFWKELAQTATRLLREVAELARAYCWSEADILALSPRRRRAYLELMA